MGFESESYDPFDPTSILEHLVIFIHKIDLYKRGDWSYMDLLRFIDMAEQ